MLAEMSSRSMAASTASVIFPSSLRRSLYRRTFFAERTQMIRDFHMNEQVKKLLKEEIWYLATFDCEPNAVPVAFKDVTDDGKLLVGDVFPETTLQNIKKNGRIAVSACIATAMEGYQIRGTAEYVTDGPVVETFKKLAEDTFNGAVTAKGALIITPERVIVTTPGADNKKEL